MTKLAILSYILIQFLFINSHVECEQYGKNQATETETEVMIDPHSIYFQRYEKQIIVQPGSENSNEEMFSKEGIQPAQDFGNQENCKQNKIYYKRLINMLLSNAAMKQEGSFVEGKLYIQASTKQIEMLQNFGNDKLSLYEIDVILSEIIKKPQFNIVEEATEITEHILWFIKEHKEVIVPIIMTILILTIFKNIVWSRGMIFMFILLAIFLISFIITYWQLLQEAEIKLTAAQAKFREMPSACLPNQMSIFEKLSSFFYTNNDCEEYHRAVMTNPKLQVTPALVLSRLFSTVVFHPLATFGHAVSEFVENATGKLSGPMRWLIICLLFLAICLLVIVLPFCLTGGGFSISLGPLFRCSISGGRSSRNYNFLENSGRPEALRRIEEISDDRPTPKAAIIHSHDTDNCATVKAITNAEHNNGSEPQCHEFKSKMNDGSGDANAHNVSQKVTELLKCGCQKQKQKEEINPEHEEKQAVQKDEKKEEGR